MHIKKENGEKANVEWRLRTFYLEKRDDVARESKTRMRWKRHLQPEAQISFHCLSAKTSPAIGMGRSSANVGKLECPGWALRREPWREWSRKFSPGGRKNLRLMSTVSAALVLSDIEFASLGFFDAEGNARNEKKLKKCCQKFAKKREKQRCAAMTNSCIVTTKTYTNSWTRHWWRSVKTFKMDMFW